MPKTIEPISKPIADLLTVHQLCGIFNKDRRAVEKLGIPRINFGPGDYRYDPDEVRTFIESKRESH